MKAPATASTAPGCGRTVEESDMAKGICISGGCESSAFSRQRCKKHYNADYHAGKLKPLTLEDKFWAKVERTATCWNWTGSLSHGYGRHNQAKAHRVAYELTNGPIPPDREIDHKCRNRACVNPSHLRLVTRKQNEENIDVRRNSQSGVRGVSWSEARKKWIVHVTHNRQVYDGGGYVSLAEAERVARDLRNRLFTHNELDRRCG